MEAKVIKTEIEHEEALAEIERLIDCNPVPGSEVANALELLSVLVREYEDRHFPIPLPDPIEAIEFRMEQLGLSRRDLIPFVGNPSKVSEVLAGKRPLTLAMIRALEGALGIPASILIQARPVVSEDDEPEWDKFPISEMIKRGWIQKPPRRSAQTREEIMETFLRPLGGHQPLAFLRRTRGAVRAGRSMDSYALRAWLARVCIVASQSSLGRHYTAPENPSEFLAAVAQLSATPDGPLKARQFLNSFGIHLIIEPHLPRTRLDGAAMRAPDGSPVIGMSLRYDRLDNFWFCLLHELAHVLNHLDATDASGSYFVDDLDAGSESDPREGEADQIAREALVPSKVLRASRASRIRTPGAVQELAAGLGVHPSVVAGRVRFESKNYRILNQLIGSGEVKRLFLADDLSTSR